MVFKGNLYKFSAMQPSSGTRKLKKTFKTANNKICHNTVTSSATKIKASYNIIEIQNYDITHIYIYIFIYSC